MENSPTGIDLIADERYEQITKHGRDVWHDTQHNNDGQLIDMAAHLLIIDRQEGIDSDMLPVGWDSDTCIYMLQKPRKERLIIAGALIAAELDRLAQEDVDDDPNVEEYNEPCVDGNGEIC